MRLAQAYVAELEAEIERLRAENDHFNTENERAWNEIERLASALRNIIAGNAGECGCAESARAALKGDEALFPTKKICPECGQRMREDGYCDHIPF